MSSSKVIKGKIKTVGSIKKMTRAMEMIARTKMKRAIDNALSARPYAVYARELLINLTRSEKLSHPLLHKGKGDKTLLIIIAADRGLCGGYNTHISRTVLQSVTEAEHIDALTIGRRAGMIAKKAGLETIASYTHLPDPTPHETVHEIAETIRTAFSDGSYRDVKIVYTNFISSLKQTVTTRTVLPISPDRKSVV